MKKTFTLLLLALYCICGYAQTIAPALLEEMGQRRDNEKIRVFVIMRQQYDQQQLNRRAAQFVTRAERRDFVVNELKQFAEVSQYDIRQSLDEMERNGMVTEPRIIWMANALYFSATKQAIYDLARRNDVEVIGFDEEKEIVFDEESRPVPRALNITPNITQVNADQVWNLGYTGQGVVVAIIDTGVNYEHLDLVDHLWNGGSDFPHHGWDIGDNDNDPMDDHGHGTHCAGTVCGDGGGSSITGMAPDVSLMCIKARGSSGYTVAKTCNCMQWAVEHGADIFSMSLGWSNPDNATRVLFRNTCEAVLDAGVIGSISAGNNGNKLSQYPIPNNICIPGGCPPPYLDPVQQANPGGLSCSVCVGAVDYNDDAADFTSIGPVTWSNTSYADYPYVEGSSSQFGLISPDVCAPGVDVISADYSNISGYCVKSGTSMAAPCVAGCMALMLSKNPELAPADICRILEETAVPLAEGKSNVYGFGRVDVLAAVNAIPDNILSLASYTIHDEQGNNNQQLNSGESVTMDMDLRCGPNALNNAVLNITSASEYVTITNGTIDLPDFAAGQTQTVSGFAFSVLDDAPIRRKMTFYADVLVGGESVGQFAFTLAVTGKIMVYEGAIIVNDDNANGLLEPGETADMRVFINNTGNATAQSVMGTLSTLSEYLTVNSSTEPLGDVGVYTQVYVDFNVTLSVNANDLFEIPCSLILVDDENQTTEFEFTLVTITTTANPQGAGFLTGAGTFGTGTTVSISAIPDSGHTFISWKRGNSVVSYTDFTVNVSESVTYVANFSAINNVIPVGQAVASDEILPTHSNYKYTLAEQLYTADELGEACEISSVAFFNAGTSKNRKCSVFLKSTEKNIFQNGSDWVAVSTEDKLFEGDITFAHGEWTTIYFDRAFNYDGIHNVIMVVDDNTGSYSRGMACRVYEGGGNQSIYNLSDNTNFDPYNPSGFPGYYINDATHKSQVLFGIASYDYTVSVSVDPADGGTVSVDEGPFYLGQPCTVSATPSGDNVFYYWSENGTRVSTDATFGFRVMANRNLVAHFGPPVNVAVVADPAEGGTVSGGGSLGIGQPLTLTAAANEGFVFSRWTLNGEAVSYTSICHLHVPGEAEYVAHFEPLAHGTMAVGQAETTHTLLPSYSYYNYSLTQQIYTADEIGGACHIGSIAFFNTGYPKTRNYTIYMVNTNKASFNGSKDWIVPTAAQQVFSGDVTMVKNGWTTITFDNEFVYDGTSNLALIVDDNSGNWTYNHMSCRVYEANGNQAIRIYSDDVDYDPMNPSSYSGTRLSVKNQIILGRSSYHFTNAGTWGNANNWCGGVLPGVNDSVSIDANCSLNKTVTVAALTVTAGNTLTLKKNKTLTVTNTLTNSSAAGLVIKDGAQLINASENVAATMEKDITAFSNSNPDGWYTIASPMNEMAVAGSDFATYNYDLYRFNETSLTHKEWENYKANLANFTTFENGRGYLYANGNAFSPTFTGTLNAASVTIPLTCTERPNDEFGGFNLIGNPFPHEIYKGEGGAIDNANLASGYYTLTNEGTWEVHSFDDAILPGQGILVKATAPTNLTISKNIEAAYSESGEAKMETAKLRISVEGDDGKDRAYVYFGQGIGLDKVEDLGQNAPSLAIRAENQDFAIAHFDKKSDVIELVFNTPNSGDVTLKVKAINSNFDSLHLFDTSTGTDIDLLQQPSYTFSVSSQAGERHFKLLYKQSEK